MCGLSFVLIEMQSWEPAYLVFNRMRILHGNCNGRLDKSCNIECFPSQFATEIPELLPGICDVDLPARHSRLAIFIVFACDAFHFRRRCKVDVCRCTIFRCFNVHHGIHHTGKEDTNCVIALQMPATRQVLATITDPIT
jgi:hypothetical protein